MMNKLKIFILLLPFLLLNFSCQDNNRSAAEEETKQIDIIYSNWSEGIAVSFLVKNILENELGYEVSLKLAQIDSAYKELASGEYDLMLDAWLPETHEQYYQQYNRDLRDAGVIFENAEIGLAVPEEAQISNISQLEDYTEIIYGISPEAGIMMKTEEVLESYDLDLSLKAWDEKRMITALDSLYKRKEPVVVTAWKPHFVFSRYDLKFLKDPKNVFPRSEAIHALVNTNTGENNPDLMKFLDRIHLNQEQLSSLIQEVQAHQEGEDEGAKQWIKNNQLLVSQWIKNLKEFKAKPM